ncbi:hypothetical protein M5689_019778 [Euphorbia peplus]|nr:hypothetical protein M5689_019778 [Euphorbia peplus]
MEEKRTRARNIGKEDSNSRRVFLRSYPLKWEDEDEEEDQKTTEEKSRAIRGDSQKKAMKKMIVSILHWSEGKVVILRRFKDKVTVYIIACIPTGFKPPRNLISAS